MVGKNDELACVYAALILADDNIAITSDKINAVLKAANYDVEPYWPGLFANALEGLKVKDLVSNIGSGAGAAAPAAGAAPAAAAAPAAGGKKEEAKKEEPKKKEEKKPESDEEGDMGFGLFD